MKCIAIPVLLILSIVPAVAQSRSTGTAPEALQYPPLAKTEGEKRILSTITEAVRAGELYANVPAVDGQMLRVLAESDVERPVSIRCSGNIFKVRCKSEGPRGQEAKCDFAIPVEKRCPHPN